MGRNAGGRADSDARTARRGALSGGGTVAQQSAALVEAVLNEIVDSLLKEGLVKISAFGTFLVREKGPRIGRNPKTGQEVPIPPRRVLVFRPSQLLKERINAGQWDRTR